MAKVKITGVKELQNKLNNISNNLHDIEGVHSYSFGELFNANFMKEYTNFSSFTDLLLAGGWIINNNDDFTNIPCEALDNHIKSNTKFNNWNEMKTKASEELIIKKILN